MKLLRLAPENTKFGFMRFRRVSYPLSATLSIISVLMFLFVGMNFGIDFAGGTQVDMRAKSGEAHLAEIRGKADGEEQEVGGVAGEDGDAADGGVATEHTRLSAEAFGTRWRLELDDVFALVYQLVGRVRAEVK